MSDHRSSIVFSPPRFRIDLSLAPRLRYLTIGKAYRTQLRSLTILYGRLLQDVGLPERLLPLVYWLSRLLLRRVFESEQTEELRGITEVTSIPLYLLVALNVVLDLLMGCTSGGILSLEDNKPVTDARMLHFRTLDWTMDPLRQVIVQLDFVRSKSPTPNRVVASSITYVGFVGVLTGVREGLSMSLNFRAVHDAASKKDHLKFYCHHLLVLFGQRPSIASLLRNQLLQVQDLEENASMLLDGAVADLMEQRTTAAYLIFSNGKSTVAIEKDYSRSMLSRSDKFIVRTNHDMEDHKVQQLPAPVPLESTQFTDLLDLLQDSRQRLDCIASKWKQKVEASKKLARRVKRGSEGVEAAEDVFVSRTELINWLCTWTTSNECTHYAVLMDPQRGQISWCRAYLEPLRNPHDRTTTKPKQWVSKRRGRKFDKISLAAMEDYQSQTCSGD